MSRLNLVALFVLFVGQSFAHQSGASVSVSEQAGWSRCEVKQTRERAESRWFKENAADRDKEDQVTIWYAATENDCMKLAAWIQARRAIAVRIASTYGKSEARTMTSYKFGAYLNPFKASDELDHTHPAVATARRHQATQRRTAQRTDFAKVSSN
ncbi:hypothetical protein K2X33_10735 [bacterium]|nr:hypothetical protein [bacterium]